MTIQGIRIWKDSHFHGFIVNAHRNPNASYLVLHRADCGHLSRTDVRHWTDQYIKICATNVGDLIRWAETSVPGYRRLTACKTCDP